MGHCLVGAYLICGLLICAGWPHCFCHVSELENKDAEEINNCKTRHCTLWFKTQITQQSFSLNFAKYHQLSMNRDWQEHLKRKKSFKIIGEALVGMMGQIGITVDTERTVVWDYGFPVCHGNPAMALVCPVWLWGMAGVGGCTAHMASLLLCWAACQVVSRGDCEILWWAP